MKFLVMIQSRLRHPTRPHDPEFSDPLVGNRATKDWINQQIADGIIECAYYIPPEMGMCIIDVASHEMLLAKLREWPLSSYMEFDLHPLVDINAALDDNHARIEQVLQKIGAAQQ